MHLNVTVTVILYKLNLLRKLINLYNYDFTKYNLSWGEPCA